MCSRVQRRGAEDLDRVDLVVGEQLVDVGIAARSTFHSWRRRSSTSGARIAQRDHVAVLVLEIARHVELRDVAGPDDADTHTIHVRTLAEIHSPRRPDCPTVAPCSTRRPTARRSGGLPARARYDHELVHRIVDEALHCHVGFAVEGKPWVVPTIHARVDDTLYLHGAVANQMLRSLDGGVEACVTMTLVDGLVLARSAFHHSMNYRSVMIFGRATRVDDPVEKLTALHALVEHVVAGRNADARPPSESELRKTLVLRLPIAEVSAKVRTGGPVDDEDDLRLSVWAGVLPVAPAYGTPIAEPEITAEVPAYVRDYTR